jgi:hypothetical protein
VSPIEHVGRLAPIGWRGGDPAAHEELQCYLSLLQAVPGRDRCRRLQRIICPVGEDVGAIQGDIVHECCRGSVAYCQKWFEVGNVLVELSDEVRRPHWLGSQGE